MYQIVVIGVSAGGLAALQTLLGGLREGFNLATVLVQHRSRESEALCELLQDAATLPVHEVTDKMPIEAGAVYLAPPDYHLLIENGFFSLSTEEPVMFSRPSVDVALESAADAYGPRTVGVVLTGANRDGARGLRRVVDAGGYAVVQDPASAEVGVMPAAALKAVPEAQCIPLAGIAAHLRSLPGAERPVGEPR